MWNLRNLPFCEERKRAGSLKMTLSCHYRNTNAIATAKMKRRKAKSVEGGMNHEKEHSSMEPLSVESPSGSDSSEVKVKANNLSQESKRRSHRSSMQSMETYPTSHSQASSNNTEDDRQMAMLSTLIAEANEAYSTGRMDQALELYDRLLALDPDNGVLSANRSAILLRLGRAEEACQEAETAIRLCPGWAKAHFRKVEALRSVSRFDDALVSFATALGLEPENEYFLSAFFELVKESSIWQNLVDSLPCTQHLLSSQSLNLLFALIGEQFLNLKEFVKSKHFLELSLSKIEQNTNGNPALQKLLLLNLCQCCLTLKQNDEIHYYFHKFWEAFDRIEKEKSFEHQRNNQISTLKHALSIFTSVSTVEPFVNKFIPSLREKLNILILKNGDQKYILKLALEQAEQLLDNKEDPAEAEKGFKGVLEMDPTNLQALIGIGKSLFKMSQWDKALAFFKRVECLSSSDDSLAELFLEALLLRSKCSLLQGSDPTRVLSALEKCVEKNVQHKKCLESSPKLKAEQFSLLCHCQKDVPKGTNGSLRESAKRLLQIGLEQGWKEVQSQALAYLFLAFFQRKKWESAKTIAREYVNIVEDTNVLDKDFHVYILQLVGNLCLNQNDCVEALKLFKRRLEFLTKRFPQSDLNTLKALMNVHSDIIKLCRRTKELAICKASVDAEKSIVEQAKQLFSPVEPTSTVAPSGSISNNQRLLLELEATQLEDSADALIASGDENFEEAAEHLEQALMLAQEMGNAVIRETRLAEKLGYLQSRVGTEEDALVYHQQHLALSKQLRRPDSVFNAYEAIGGICSRLERWNDALSAYRCSYQMSKLLERPLEQQLQIALRIGKILLKQLVKGESDRKVVMALFEKLKRLAREGQDATKCELAIVYGCLGELHLIEGDRKKAFSYFTRQLPLFSHINDPEGKSETLRQLIEERRAAGDFFACQRLCELRFEAVSNSNGLLRIEVLRECSAVFGHFGRWRESLRWMEKAFKIAVEQMARNTTKVLLELCEVHIRLGEGLAAIGLLETFIRELKEMEDPELILRLLELYSAEGVPLDGDLNLLQKSDKLRESLSSATIAYRFACVHFQFGDYQKATEFLRVAEENASLDQSEEDGALSQVKIDLGKWLLAVLCDPSSMGDFLQQQTFIGLCSRVSADRELSGLLHWTLWHGEFEQTLSLIKLLGKTAPYFAEKYLLNIFSGNQQMNLMQDSLPPVPKRGASSVPSGFLSPTWDSEMFNLCCFLSILSHCMQPLRALALKEAFCEFQVKSKTDESGQKESLLSSSRIDMIEQVLLGELSARISGIVIAEFGWHNHRVLWIKEQNETQLSMYRLSMEASDKCQEEGSTQKSLASVEQSFFGQMLARIFDEDCCLQLPTVEPSAIRRHILAAFFAAESGIKVTLVGGPSIWHLLEDMDNKNHELFEFPQCERLSTLVQNNTPEEKRGSSPVQHKLQIAFVSATNSSPNFFERNFKNFVNPSTAPIVSCDSPENLSKALEMMRKTKILCIHLSEDDGSSSRLMPNHFKQYRIRPELLIIVFMGNESEKRWKREEAIAEAALLNGTKLALLIGEESLAENINQFYARIQDDKKMEWTLDEICEYFPGKKAVYGNFFATFSFALELDGNDCFNGGNQESDSQHFFLSEKSLASLRNSRRWRRMSQRRRSEEFGARRRRRSRNLSERRESFHQQKEQENEPFFDREENNFYDFGVEKRENKEEKETAQIFGIDFD